MTKLILLGTGGHAKVLADILLQNGQEVCATVSLDERPSGFPIVAVPHYTDDRLVFDFSPNDYLLVNGIGALPKSALRKKIFLNFKEKGFSFASVVSPRAIVSPFATLSEGIQVMAGAVLQAGATLLSNSLINTGACVDHDCVIGEHSHIAPSATLCGHVVVGNKVHVGAGATVLQSICIEDRAIIGVGANVTCDVPEDSTVYGVRSHIVEGN